MQSFIQIVGQASQEGPPTIVLHHRNQRYMFNCREGTQRLCVEEKVKLAKLTNVFLTRLQWQCTGGLPGMLLTLADSGIKNLNIYGGKNLTHYMVSLRHFVYRSSTTVDTHEFDRIAPKPFNDGALQVTPVVILPDEFDESNVVRRGTKRRRHSSSEESSMSNSEKEWDLSERQKARLEVDSMTVEHQMAHRRAFLSQMFGRDVHEQNKLSEVVPPPSEAPDAHVDLNPINKSGKPKATVKDLGSPCEPPKAVNYFKSLLPRTTPYPATICYICQGAPIRGKFNVKAAKELGIPAGKLYSQLQAGSSVTLEDGRVITPEQVLAPDISSRVFIIVDCPDTNYIADLASAPGFEPYYGGQDTAVVLHMVSDSVLNDTRYQAWMGRFGKDTEHIIGTESISAQTVQFKRHALAQYKLSKFDSRIFPIPYYNNAPTSKLEQYCDLPSKCIPMANMDTYNLHPKVGIDRNTAVFNHTGHRRGMDVQKFDDNVELQSAIKQACTEASKVDVSAAFPGSEVQIITLGTGSSVPAKYRNVSATMVKIPKYGTIMLDAGEGTFGQMMRLFGPERLAEELSAIRCIFVSHMHADHHLGVIQLINKWYSLNKGLKKAIYVVAPFIFQRWISEYSNVEKIGRPRQVRYIRNEVVAYKPKTSATSWAAEENDIQALKDLLGLSAIKAVNVVHCPNAFGLTLEHDSGWKLVYSGDTRPCEELVEAGQSATLLIHEATLDDSMMDEALKKKHSTTGEAVKVGQRMNARYTLLNHFSQRYPKIPSLSQDQENVCFSFDFMTVSIKDIPKLPKFTPALQLLFEEDAES